MHIPYNSLPGALVSLMLCCISFPASASGHAGIHRVYTGSGPDTSGNPVAAQAYGTITKDTAVRLVSARFGFTEGPAVDKRGNIFFTDQPNDQIWKYDTDGKLSLFMEHAGRSNGLYFDRQGNLLSCADEQDQLWKISPNKKVTVLVKDYRGQRLNGPNDLWADRRGGIYFTDPYYQRPYWNRQHPDMTGEKVYYLPTGKSEPQIAAENVARPNGIVGTPDGRYLYVADIKANKTYRYSIAANGALKDPVVLMEQGSDGMTLDDRGNIYLTGNGVTVYNASGQKIGHIDVPSKWTANVCFGGKARNVLFITASEAVYVITMLVKGVE